MRKFLFWPLIQFLFGKGKGGELSSFAMHGETTQWASVRPGDILCITNRVEGVVIGGFQIPIDKEWCGEFAFQWDAKSKNDQKVVVTYPDGSKKTFKPGTGIKWVEAA